MEKRGDFVIFHRNPFKKSSNRVLACSTGPQILPDWVCCRGYHSRSFSLTFGVAPSQNTDTLAHPLSLRDQAESVKPWLFSDTLQLEVALCELIYLNVSMVSVIVQYWWKFHHELLQNGRAYSFSCQ